MESIRLPARVKREDGYYFSNQKLGNGKKKKRAPQYIGKENASL